MAATSNSSTGSASNPPPAAPAATGAIGELTPAALQEQPGEPPAGERNFDDIYRGHFDFACRSLRLLGVAPDALEDAAQDVFGVALRRLDEFAGQSSIKTWIFAIVQRVASNHRRTQRRKQSPLEALSDLTPGDTPSPEAEAQAAQSAALIQEFSNNLDEDRRALLALGIIEGVPVREIALALGIAVPTAYARLRALRRTLERFLAQQEEEHG